MEKGGHLGQAAHNFQNLLYLRRMTSLGGGGVGVGGVEEVHSFAEFTSQMTTVGTIHLINKQNSSPQLFQAVTKHGCSCLLQFLCWWCGFSPCMATAMWFSGFSQPGSRHFSEEQEMRVLEDSPRLRTERGCQFTGVVQILRAAKRYLHLRRSLFKPDGQK